MKSNKISRICDKKYKLKENKVWRITPENEGEYKMATQIAVTPILYGKEALNVIKEIKDMPSQKAKENGKKLIDLFNKMTY